MSETPKEQLPEDVAASAFSLMSAGLCVGNHDRIIVACDDNYAALLDRTREEIVGLRVEDITHPDDVRANIWLLSNAIDCCRPFDIRKRYLLPSGAVRWVENRVSSVPSELGKLVIVVSRPIPVPSNPKAAVREAMREYLSDMAAQLAVMSREAGLPTSAEAFDAATVLSRIEKLP